MSKGKPKGFGRKQNCAGGPYTFVGYFENFKMTAPGTGIYIDQRDTFYGIYPEHTDFTFMPPRYAQIFQAFSPGLNMDKFKVNEGWENVYLMDARKHPKYIKKEAATEDEDGAEEGGEGDEGADGGDEDGEPQEEGGDPEDLVDNEDEVLGGGEEVP